MNPIRWFESLHPAWYVTSRYGPRTGKYAGFHNGVDLGGGGGCNAIVRTPFAGKVRLATGQGTGTWGKIVVVEIAEGLLQLSSHHNDFKCKKGDIVKQGDPIATNGGTNNTSVPYSCHIHYEIRIDDGSRAVGGRPWGDPEKFTLIQGTNSEVYSAGDLIEMTARVPLNIRQHPNASSLIIGQLLFGERVKIISHPDNGVKRDGYHWWCIDINGGWVAEDFIKMATTEPVPHFIEHELDKKPEREVLDDGATDKFYTISRKVSNFFKSFLRR